MFDWQYYFHKENCPIQASVRVAWQESRNRMIPLSCICFLLYVNVLIITCEHSRISLILFVFSMQFERAENESAFVDVDIEYDNRQLFRFNEKRIIELRS